jgi:hypothetical protein
LDCIGFWFEGRFTEYSETTIAEAFANRPTDGITTVPLYLKSDCVGTFQIGVTSIDGLIVASEAEIEMLGASNGFVTLNQNEEATGALKIKAASPLGYIPILVLVKQNGVELASFIVGKARIDAANKQFAIVSDVRN